MSFIVARYGEFVLLRPPLKPEHPGCLWLLPPLALGWRAAFALWAYSRRRAKSARGQDQALFKLTARRGRECDADRASAAGNG